MKAICCSVNVDRVVMVLGGGGDTSTLYVISEGVSTFCTKRWWGMKKVKTQGLTYALT